MAFEYQEKGVGSHNSSSLIYSLEMKVIALSILS